MEEVGILGLRSLLRPEEPLLLGVGLDEPHLLRRTSREFQVAQRLRIDREHPDRGAVLGGHVRDGGPVGHRKGMKSRAEELDEPPHDPLLPQHLRHREHEIRGGRSLGQLPRHAEPDDLREEHGHRLPQHRGLGLDPSDAPSQHAEAVDHRRVGIGADERVGIGQRRRARAREHNAGQELEIHLVDDPGRGRDDAEILERALPPPEEEVALAIPLELLLGIDQERGAGSIFVHLDGVIDDQLRGLQRIDPFGVAAQIGHRVPHGRQVHDGGNSCEVL